MSFISGMRGIFRASPGLSEKWEVPESSEQITDWITESEKPLLIYKHSYNCAVCIFSKIEVEKLFDTYGDQIQFVFVDVIAQRAISSHIAGELGVKHESPQALLIRKGTVYWSASHGSIREKAMIDALSKL
jgi:bacillithiol system protein YtxJ